MSSSSSTPVADLATEKKLQSIAHFDPYTKLFHKSAAVRNAACISLIKDIYRNHEHDKQVAEEAGSEVKLNSEGLTIHLEYVLSRLITGLESVDPYARIGFSTALTIVLQEFSNDILSTAAIQAKILERQSATVGMTQQEILSFDLGRLFLAQSLHAAKRLGDISSELLDAILVSARRLLKHKGASDVCVETLVVLAESCYKTSSKHYQSLLDALIGVLPDPNAPFVIKKKKSKKALLLLAEKSLPAVPSISETDEMKDEAPAATEIKDEVVDDMEDEDADEEEEEEVDEADEEEPETPQQTSYRCNFRGWTPATLSAALCLRRLGQQQAYAHVCEGLLDDEETWQPIFDFLQRTFNLYPIVPSVWKHIFTDLFSISTSTTAFERFWTTCIIPGLSAQRPYFKKAIAIDLVITVLGLFYNQDAEKPLYTKAQIERCVTVILSPHIIKLMIIHCRAKDTPLHSEATRLATVIQQIGEKYTYLIPLLVGLCTTPAKGGHRLFDTKSSIPLVSTLINKLQPSELIEYTENTIKSFYDAEALAKNDVYFIAELTKKQQSELAQLKAGSNSKQEAEPEEEVDTKNFGLIQDVDEFMQGPVAQAAIKQSIDALRSWVIDHIYHLADMLLSIQKKNKKALATAATDDDKTEVVQDNKEENTIKECLTLLYTQSFYQVKEVEEEKPTTKKRKTKAAAAAAKKPQFQIVELSPKVRELAAQRYTSLFSALLLSDGHYVQYSQLRPYIGATETRWSLFIIELSQQLRDDNCLPINSSLTEIAESIDTSLETLDKFAVTLRKLPVTESEDSKLPSVHKKTLDIVLVLKYVISTTYALAPSDAEVLTGVCEDFPPIVEHVKLDYEKQVKPKRRGRKAAAAPEDEDDTPWVEVLVDILLSLLGLGHNVLRHVALRTFKLLVPLLTMESIHDLISTFVKQDAEQEQEEKEDKEEVVDNRKDKNDKDSDSDDDLLDSDDDSDDESKDEKDDFGDIFQEIAKVTSSAAAKTEQDDNEDEDAENDEDDENNQVIDETGVLDLLLGNPNTYIPREEEEAISQIVKLQKEQFRSQKNKTHDRMVMKLRILDLVEIIAQELPWSNAWLSLLLPSAVLITSSHSVALQPLHKRATTIFQKTLCNVSNVPALAYLNGNNKTPLWETLKLAEVTHGDILIPQEQCSVDHLKHVIQAIFESIGTSTNNEQSQMIKAADAKGVVSAQALLATSSLLLTLPISQTEQDEAKKTILEKTSPAAAAEPVEDAKPKRKNSKAAKSKEPAFEEIQRYVFYNRLKFITHPLQNVLKRSFQKKKLFTPIFFTTLFNNELFGFYSWGVPKGLQIPQSRPAEVMLLNTMRIAMTKASTPFIRKTVAEIVAETITYYKAALLQNSPEYLVEVLVGVYNEVISLLTTPPSSTNAQQQKAVRKIYNNILKRATSYIRLFEQHNNLTATKLAPVPAVKQDKPKEKTKSKKNKKNDKKAKQNAKPQATEAKTE